MGLPPAGLVAAYGFEEGTGNTASDGSGNALAGTINGATWTTDGKFGKALSFNGATSFVDLGNPTALQVTGSMTIEAWVKASANPADDGQIVSKWNGSGWQFKTSPDTGPHTFGFGVSGAGSGMTQRYSSSGRSLSTWYHIAGVYDATARTLSTYVNGVLNNGQLSGTVPSAQVNPPVNVNIGRRTDDGFHFSGVIDEVRIYNRALTPTEIQTDMATPVISTGPKLTITQPGAGATIAGTVVDVAYTSTGDQTGVHHVHFQLDSNPEVMDLSFDGVYQFTSVPTGTHTLVGHLVRSRPLGDSKHERLGQLYDYRAGYCSAGWSPSHLPWKVRTCPAWSPFRQPLPTMSAWWACNSGWTEPTWASRILSRPMRSH